jgi:class 3 adenylate cyclase/tetratricopeptide (TPR) repeat protein
MLCPNCGFENADGANFCSNCGYALAVAAEPRREERKVVTVVFADLVGSTARAERLDPEDVRAILAPYHDRLRTELERYGGTVEKFIGDAVVGVFGAPVAHEDDPERAVRAALAIQEAIAVLNESDPALELEVRIGVNTGEALVALGARPELGEAMVAGDVMNTGARLQSAAPGGGVLVSDATYRVTSRAIEYGEAETIEAKGKADPLAAWPAVAPRARFGVDIFQAGRAPLVGREREVELLASALARAREEREPQLVTIVGVPGMGKSRLVYELSRIVNDDPELIVWRQGRSLPYGEGVAFWALGEIVKAQAGILESDGSAEAGAKLAAATAGVARDDELDWLERHLRPLVGLGGDAASGQEQRAEAFAAWRRFVEALAEHGPVVLVFEDLQWADDGLLDFVDELADRLVAVSLLVVCSARPELLERRPGWGGGKRNALTVSLAPLGEADTARLLGALLDRSVLPADEQAALLQRAGGNPLYAEEYARMLADGGQSDLGVPATLQGVVAARIDALADAEKLLLQQASVLGKVFWTDGLAALAELGERAVEETLFSLERKEFVRREQRSAVAGARQYVFVHALVQDGAYGQMPRAVRADAHRRVAEWIEELPSDRSEDRSEMLAHHLVHAIEYGEAAGVNVSSLRPKVALALREAGDRAWSLGAPHAALTLFEQAAALHPESADDPYLLLRLGRALLIVRGEGERELERASVLLSGSNSAAAAEAEVAHGEAIWQRGDQESAFAHFDRAASLVETVPVSTQKGWIVAQLARFLVLAGRYRDGRARAEEAIALAEELGESELLGDALNTRGVLRSVLEEPGWVEDFERSLGIALANNSWRAGRAYINLGSSLMTSKAELRRAEELFREGLGFTAQRSSVLVERWFRGNLGELTFHLGSWDEALELAESEFAYKEPHYQRHMMRLVRAQIRLARGSTQEALADVDLAVGEAQAVRDPQALIPTLAARLFMLAASAETLRAEETLAQLSAARGELEAQPAGPWIVDVALALRDLGHTNEAIADSVESVVTSPWRESALAIARGDLVAAADALEALGAATLEAHARLRAARQLTEEGRCTQAQEQLARALAFHRDVRASALIGEGEALLAEAS